MDGVEGGLIKVDETREEKGVGREQLHGVALAVAPAMVERLAVMIPEVRLEESGIAFSGGEIVGVAESCVSAGESAQHEAVPGGEDLVVSLGANALVAGVEESGFGGGQERMLGVGESEVDQAENVLVAEWLGVAMVDEVAGFGDAEGARGDGEFVGREEGSEFSPGPTIEFAFVALAIGVFGREEPAFGVGHVAKDIMEDIVGDEGEGMLPAGQVCFEVKLDELGVVVEHFFEVRDQPGGVDGIACEAAAEVIVDSAGVHALAGFDHHAQ